MSDDIQVIHRCLERERLARKKAESLLEMREAELLDRHHELTTVVSIMRGQLEMLEDAVNSMLVAIVTLEVDGTIRLFNPAEMMRGGSNSGAFEAQIRGNLPLDELDRILDGLEERARPRRA